MGNDLEVDTKTTTTNPSLFGGILKEHEGVLGLFVGNELKSTQIKGKQHQRLKQVSKTEKDKRDSHLSFW